MSTELSSSLSIDVHEAQELDPRPIQACGGASEELLPVVETMLTESEERCDFQMALRDLVPQALTKKYQSLVDLLICEFHRKWFRACSAFYSKKGPPLRDIVPAKEIEWLSEDIVLALIRARALHKNGRGRQWKQYRLKMLRKINHRASTVLLN